MRTATQDTGVTFRAGGLALQMAEDGSVRMAASGTHPLPLLDRRGGFEVAEYLGPLKGARTLKASSRSDGSGLRLTYDGGKLALSIEPREADGYLSFHGKLTDTSGRDRALIVSFSLPLNALGWTWWDDPNRQRCIVHGLQYASYGLLGERRDIAVSKLPFATVTHRETGLGIALAVPPTHPRVYRLSYGTDRGYRVEFDLGLSPATRKFPGQADFTFIMYAVDPVWALRSTAERFYAYFPEQYVKRVPRDGASTFAINKDFMPDPAVLDEYGIGFVWTASSPVHQDPALMAYLKRNKVLSIKHREPWARWHLVYPLPGQPWYTAFPDRRVDLSGVPAQPPLERELEMLREEARAPESVRDGNDQIPGPVRDIAQATLNCLVYDEHDRPRITLWHRWTQGWHSQIPLNVDPDLPEPNRATMARLYQFQNMAGWGDPDSDMADTVSWDSLTDWTGFHLEDFRRDAFQYLDEPLTFHYGTGRLMTLCGFHDFEMAQQWCREARAKGGYIMSNTEPQAMLYLGQFLDAAGWECSPDDQSEDDMLLIRCLMDQKPCFFYRRAGEDGMRKMMAYGLFLSSAPIGPGGEEGAARGRREGDYRRLYLKYARRAIQLSSAGWRPVTHARAIPARPATDYQNGTHLEPLSIAGATFYRAVGDVYEEAGGQLTMERFGDAERGLLFTLRSATGYDRAIVLIDLGSLGLVDKPVRPVELVEGRPLVWDVEGRMMRVVVPITRGETLVLSLSKS